MALGKGAYAIHQSGKWYTNENIDQMLMERHLNKKVRRSSHKNHMKGPRKRTEEDDVRFAQSFEKLILMARSKSNVTKGIWLSALTLGVSVPNFIVALLLLIIFGVELRIFPVLGLTTPMHYVLPAIAQGLYPISAVARQTQNSYEEVMRQDYITMAKAKGISKTTLLFRHILKNAMLPVITYMGPMVAFLLTGSVVIEQIYTIPGIGKEFVSAITNHDYTVVMGITIFIGAIIIVCNLLSDLICAIVDPRVRKSL